MLVCTNVTIVKSLNLIPSSMVLAHTHNLLFLSGDKEEQKREARVKVFIGVEYECPKGHRFMSSEPNRILRYSSVPGSGGDKPGNASKDKENARDVVDNDMPLYMNCSCR